MRQNTICEKNMLQISSKACKLKHSSNDAIPNLSEVRACLGSTLAQVFCDYSHDETKKLLDVIPAMCVSQKTSSILATDQPCYNALPTLPRTDEVIKADVHQNILELGEDFLKTFQTEIEERVQEAEERKFKEKLNMYKAKKRRERELYEQILHGKYDDYIRCVQGELERKLEIEWGKVQYQCIQDIQKAVVRERLNVTHEMLRRMRTEISYVVNSIYADFEQLFRARQENIISDFNGIMRREHIKLKENIRKFEIQKAKDLHVQKREIEMQNVADIIYVLCAERLRCRMAKHKMHKHFQEKITAYQDLVTRLNSSKNVLKKDIVQSYKKIKSLEKQVSEVTKEFQKFVSFALHTMPGQTGFLFLQEQIRQDVLHRKKSWPINQTETQSNKFPSDSSKQNTCKFILKDKIHLL